MDKGADMKKIRKYLSLALCLCITTYTLPAVANTSSTNMDTDYTRVELSDEQMASAVGAGNVDATMADYKIGEAAVAVLANRSILQCTYTLDVVDTNGGFVESIATGTILNGEALVVSGTPIGTQKTVIQARIWNSGVPGLESKDTSWSN